MEEILELKARWGATGRLIAGGTDLIVSLRQQSPSLEPIEVIDITRVADLGGISVEPASNGHDGPMIRLGPLARHAEIERSPEIRRSARLLAEAAAEIGSPQIRNRGTIGGNICNASSCADGIPPLVALGAELTLRSVRGARQVALEEAILQPYKTVLADDEILTDIRFRSIPEGAGSAFVKLGRREALSISRISIAVVVQRGPAGSLGGVRIAAGSVTPTVRRFPEIEKELTGEVPSEARLAAAGEALAAEMIRRSGRRWSTPYKEPVVAALLRRALARAIERSRA